jgi:hypothetical protein
LVIFKNRFYIFDAYRQINGSLLNPHEIYRILNQITQHTKPGVGIGALTADYRDNWAQLRQHLINLSHKNRDFLAKIENSIFVVCLDDNEVIDNDELSRVALLGNPKNRFFDKSYELVVTKSGHNSVNTDVSKKTSKIFCEKVKIRLIFY